MIIAFFVDGPNLVGMAMNGWADGEPAWWLNLQAHPDARVDLADGPRAVQGRAAEGQERTRLWALWRELDAKLDDYAAMRSSETAIVILEPGPDPFNNIPGTRPGMPGSCAMLLRVSVSSSEVTGDATFTALAAGGPVPGLYRAPSNALRLLDQIPGINCCRPP